MLGGELDENHCIDWHYSYLSVMPGGYFDSGPVIRKVDYAAGSLIYPLLDRGAGRGINIAGSVWAVFLMAGCGREGSSVCGLPGVIGDSDFPEPSIFPDFFTSHHFCYVFGGPNSLLLLCPGFN